MFNECVILLYKINKLHKVDHVKTYASSCTYTMTSDYQTNFKHIFYSDNLTLKFLRLSKYFYVCKVSIWEY